MSEYRGLAHATLKQLKERYPNHASAQLLDLHEGFLLVEQLCTTSQPSLELEPQLQYIISISHPSNKDSYLDRALFSVTRRGHIPHILAVLNCGANIQATQRIGYLEDRPGAGPAFKFVDESVLESALNGNIENETKVVCFLLDRGSRYDPPLLPPYALQFLEHRMRTRAAVLGFLLCWRNSSALRRCMPAGVRDMVVSYVWAGRFDVG